MKSNNLDGEPLVKLQTKITQKTKIALKIQSIETNTEMKELVERYIKIGIQLHKEETKK